MKIFIAGGTGFVGSHTVKFLLQEGHTVRLLVHRTAEGTERGVEQVRGDAADMATIAGAAEGCDAVINLVGIIREFPGRGITFRKLHVQVTRNMVDLARNAGIRRYLQMSALGTRPDAVSEYHKTKFEAEEYVRNSGLDDTIFRPSIIFGPRDMFVNMLADLVRSYPAVPVVGDGRYRLQPIAADDVARCFAMALHMRETVGQTYTLCGPDRFSYNEMLDIVGRVLGRGRVTKLRAPGGLMKLIVPVLQNIPQFPLTTDQLIMLFEESICDGSWKEVFKFEPVTFERGISEYLGKE